jgi:hypothetical protein
MIDERDLSTRLAHEADQFFTKGGAPLEIGQVLDRAGEIRRGRRMRATMLMAACLLAVAVPTALLATRSHETPVQPAHQAKVDSSPLSLHGLDQGAGPVPGYLADHAWHPPQGGAIDLSGLDDPIREVAAFKGGFLVATQTESGDLSANVVQSNGTIVGEARPMEGGFAVSDTGAAAGFAAPDGTAYLVTADGVKTFMQVPRGTGFDAVAVSGTCTGTPDDKEPCAVWVQSSGRKPASWFVTVNAASTARSQYVDLADVRGNGSLAAGTTVVRDDLTTCSAVETTRTDEPGWTTCGHQMVAFSPHGKHVLAMPDGDGLGPTGLVVYDADKGTKLLDLSVADQGYVRQMVWENDDQVLATVYQQGVWAVVRIGLDGARQYAVPPLTAQDDVEPPFLLPVS